MVSDRYLEAPAGSPLVPGGGFLLVVGELLVYYVAQGGTLCPLKIAFKLF